MKPETLYHIYQILSLAVTPDQMGPILHLPTLFLTDSFEWSSLEYYFGRHRLSIVYLIFKESTWENQA